MAGTVTFFLKDPKAKAETPIYLAFYYYNLRLKISTGEKINPKYWNQETQRARETKYFAYWDSINSSLDHKEKHARDHVRDHIKHHGTVMPETLKQELTGILRPRPKDELAKMTFFRSAEEMIRTCNKSHRTKLAYQTTLNCLRTYSNTLKKELDFDALNLDFYEDFIRYLTNDVTIKKINKRTGRESVKTGYETNTIGTRIKNIKVFMNYANDRGYTSNILHKHRKFRKLDEPSESIYLTDAELLTLYDLDLSDSAKLDRVRDLFLIGSYTGLRFSDLSQLTPEKFIKDGSQLKIKTVKTGETVVIPLHWIVREIMLKHGGQPPRIISNQKMNDYLKELGEKAGINEKITISRKNGSLQSDHVYEKWELLTVHTARRSFATNAYLANVPSISIMKITGHKTERVFMKYIKITQEQNADKLQAHPYFTKSPLKIINEQ